MGRPGFHRCSELYRLTAFYLIEVALPWHQPRQHRCVQVGWAVAEGASRGCTHVG